MRGIDRWIRCPECGSEEATVYVYSHEIYIFCTDCSAQTSHRVPSQVVGAPDQ
jgi:transcription elongation factor Elf1